MLITMHAYDILHVSQDLVNKRSVFRILKGSDTHDPVATIRPLNYGTVRKCGLRATAIRALVMDTCVGHEM